MNQSWNRQLVSVTALLLACSACSGGSDDAAGSDDSGHSAGSTGSASPVGAADATTAAAPACAVDDVTTHVPPPGVDTAFGITQGPGGTWYGHGGTINRLHADGTLDEFPIPDAATASAGWLTWDDASSAMWFSDRTNGQIGTIDDQGAVEEFKVEDGPNGADGPAGIVVGPGTEVWFTEPMNSRIGMLDTATKTVTMQPSPTADGGPIGLVRGSDGNLWFTEREADKVARMNSDGSFKEWDLKAGAGPNRIISGPDGAVWFTELNTDQIGRIDSAGQLTEMPLAGGPVGIAVGPDGHMYVALFNANQVARLHDDGSIDKTWDLPHGALLVAAGPDSMWATNGFDDSVARVQLSCS
jgi:virginiamycin B lyase